MKELSTNEMHNVSGGCFILRKIIGALFNRAPGYDGNMNQPFKVGYAVDKSRELGRDFGNRF